MYESLLELERLWLADFDQDVVGIAAQPMHLTGLDGAVVRRRVPDLFLTHVDGTCTVVDVKAAKRLARPEVQEQFAWTSDLCQAKGWRYEVFTGAPNLLMRNIRMVAAGRHAFACTPSCLEAVTMLVTEPTRWDRVESDAAERGLSQADVRPALFRLLWTGVLTADLSRPLSGRTLAGQFADQGLLDEIHLQLAPVTLGHGAPLLPRQLLASNLSLTAVDRDGQFVHLIYRVTTTASGSS
ncbi:hypothetical protein GCM10027579_10150 [Calidifontibacter terrae]